MLATMGSGRATRCCQLFFSSPAACVVLAFVQSIHFSAAVNKCEMTLLFWNWSTVILQGLFTQVLCFSGKTTSSELRTYTSKWKPCVLCSIAKWYTVLNIGWARSVWHEQAFSFWNGYLSVSLEDQRVLLVITPHGLFLVIIYLCVNYFSDTLYPSLIFSCTNAILFLFSGSYSKAENFALQLYFGKNTKAR